MTVVVLNSCGTASRPSHYTILKDEIFDSHPDACVC